MKTLYIDIETYSDIDLLSSGIYRYTQGRDFAILLFAYSVDGGEVKVVDIAQGERIPDEIERMIFSDDVIKVAHNATFERVCLSKYYGLHLYANSWRCTMAQSLRMGLPISLGEASKALGTDETKDENGKRLIRIFCVPQKPTKSNGMRTRITPQDAPGMWQQFKWYCAQDVRTEMSIDKATVVGRACGDFEQDVYKLDAIINDNGIMIDREFVECAAKIDGDARERLLEEAKRITGCDNPMSPQQLMQWLASRGIKTYTVNATRVDEIIKMTRDIDVLRVLSIRKQLGKTSTSKYSTMLSVIMDDDRARGLFQYYGTRTGRWAGRLVQMHNLPRTGNIDIPSARKAVLQGDVDNIELEFGSVTDVLSCLIRTAFVAPEGKMFVVCDYSAIEARVLSWLADEKWRLDVFRTHGKIYEATAAMLYNVNIEDIKPKDKRRDHGKVAELALGYQGGVNALTANGASELLSYNQMVQTVESWRKANPNIVKYWRDVEDAVIYSIKMHQVARVGRLTIEFIDDTLYITLPSGRYIAYNDARLDDGKVCYTDNDIKRSTVHLYGGKLVENIVQGIARDCLADAMMRIHADGYDIVGHVHDEVIVEVSDADDKAADAIKRIFDTPPEWANGLPLRGEGFTSKYYRK